MALRRLLTVSMAVVVAGAVATVISLAQQGASATAHHNLACDAAIALDQEIEAKLADKINAHDFDFDRDFLPYLDPAMTAVVHGFAGPTDIQQGGSEVFRAITNSLAGIVDQTHGSIAHEDRNLTCRELTPGQAAIVHNNSVLNVNGARTRIVETVIVVRNNGDWKFVHSHLSATPMN